MDRDEASWETLSTLQQREIDEVLRMFRDAAEQGNVEAQLRLGMLLQEGKSVKEDDVGRCASTKKQPTREC